MALDGKPKRAVNCDAFAEAIMTQSLPRGEASRWLASMAEQKRSKRNGMTCSSRFNVRVCPAEAFSSSTKQAPTHPFEGMGQSCSSDHS